MTSYQLIFIAACLVIFAAVLAYLMISFRRHARKLMKSIDRSLEQYANVLALYREKEQSFDEMMGKCFMSMSIPAQQSIIELRRLMRREEKRFEQLKSQRLQCKGRLAELGEIAAELDAALRPAPTPEKAELSVLLLAGRLETFASIVEFDLDRIANLRRAAKEARRPQSAAAGYSGSSLSTSKAGRR